MFGNPGSRRHKSVAFVVTQCNNLCRVEPGPAVEFFNLTDAACFRLFVNTRHSPRFLHPPGFRGWRREAAGNHRAARCCSGTRFSRMFHA